MSEPELVPVFDQELPYATIREFGKAVRYEQSGLLFSQQGTYIEPYKNYQPPASANPAPTERQADEHRRTQVANQTTRDQVLARAQSKLGGFQAAPDPEGAQKENVAAQHAERLAE